MNLPDSLEPLLAHVIPFTLVLFRLAGVFVMAPVLTSTMIPLKVKALLAASLAVAAYPLVAPSLVAPAETDVFGLLPLVASEALIGLCVGALAATPLLFLELGGAIMGQSVGFGLARVYNPESDIDTDLLGQLLLMLATGAFIATGGLETLFTGIVGSFARVPLGGMDAGQTPLDLFLGVMASGCDLGMRVAMPVVGSTLLLVVVMGVLGKTMPQINIMTVGFAAKVLAGLAVLMFALVAIREVAGEACGEAVADAVAWVQSLGGGR
ncbi:MAG: flagellar biosynthetic protein FliR [Phycisphaerae bacterium]|nr:MAG: flagellar biosynthetic protein FliR [Phycisphaerae bacterium]